MKKKSTSATPAKTAPQTLGVKQASERVKTAKQRVKALKAELKQARAAVKAAKNARKQAEASAARQKPAASTATPKRPTRAPRKKGVRAKSPVNVAAVAVRKTPTKRAPASVAKPALQPILPASSADDSES